MAPTTKKRLSDQAKKNPTRRYRRRKNPFKKKGVDYHSYKVRNPQFDLEEFRRNRRYLTKQVIAPKINISKSSVQVNANFSSPSSTSHNSSREKTQNVVVGTNKQNNDTNDDATITDPEYDSELSSTVSLYEGSSVSEEDSSENNNPKKQSRIVMKKKNRKANEKNNTDDESSITKPNLRDITHTKKGVRKTRVRWGIGKVYFVIEKAINKWNEKKLCGRQK